MVAAIRPRRQSPGTWALPKGAVDPGEDPAATAVREVAEETGARGAARPEARRRPLRLHAGKGPASGSSRSSASTCCATPAAGSARSHAEFEHEVAEVRWLPLEEAPRLLAYKGEREMAAKAIEALAG